MSNTKKVATVEKAAPEAIGKGRYAIYQTPQGDGVITYRPDGADEDNHTVIPKGVWTMMRKALSGEAVDASPMALLKLFMSGK